MKNDTRERLVEAARNLFLKQGYASTGIAQILEEADAGSGSLYYFFPTKEDLLLAVLEWYKANLMPQVVQPVFDRISDPIERIFGILAGYRRLLMMSECEYGCPIGNLALELANSHPQAAKLLAENFSAWRKVIEYCLAEASGRLPAAVDREQLACHILVTLEGAVMLARTYKEIGPYDAAVTQLRDHFDRLFADATQWQSPPRQRTKSKPSSKPE
jgi:TetR/AcrR family transcriptional regulator, transcriptional repressor for nem operon